MPHLPGEKPSGARPRRRATSHAQTMEVLTRQFTIFFREMLRPEDNWPRPSDEQFIEAVAESLVAVGNEVADGRGIAMLQTFVFDLQDLINAGLLPNTALVASHPTKEVRIPVVIALPKVVEQVLTWEADEPFNTDSPLSRLGYSVAADGPTPEQRHQSLIQVFELAKLPGLTATEDKKKWGAARTTQRLYSISKFLTWLCNLQGGEKPGAKERWVADLAWLKSQFYQDSMPFAWPEPTPTTKPSPEKRDVNAAFMKALTPSTDLAAVVGPNPLPRTEVVSKLWIYIKTKKLQDTANKRMINTDAKLMKIFGKKQVSMFEMAGLVGKHLR